MTTTPGLSSKDICKIIEVCSKFKVADLRIGDFCVKFSVNVVESRASLKIPAPITVPEEITQAAEASAQKTEDAIEIDEAEDEDLRLVVEDPDAWERRSLEMMRARQEENPR
jgi:hypothetical protein